MLLLLNNDKTVRAYTLSKADNTLEKQCNRVEIGTIYNTNPPSYFICFSFLLDLGQHVELHNPNPPPHVVGYIHTKMSPVEVARNASDDARSMCLREYGCAPDINIYGDPDFTFP
jgi:pyruvate dehydrogenase kinase 2/3/4